MELKGIDVSKFQGPINWQQVKNAGIQFVFIKATQGTNYSSINYFINNAPLALAAGIEVGAYHYGDFASIANAKDQANYFLSVVKPFKLTYPLVLDLEENKSGLSRDDLTTAAIAFLEILENAGYFAMLYSGKNFLETQLDESRLKPYALWVARYGPQLGRSADVWQYSSSGSIPGINGNVDMDISYRDFAAEIRSMRGQAAPPEPPKPPRIFLPANNPTWTVYKLGRPCVKANPTNIAGILKPSKFGGLTYEILADHGNYIFEIQTGDFGRVQIYGAPSTGAKIL
jgi:lysozyme